MFIRDGIVYGGEPEQAIKVNYVKVLPDMMMLIRFNNGELRLFDATLLEGPVFEPLHDEQVFSNPKIDHGVVTWLDGGIDCAPEFIRLLKDLNLRNGTLVRFTTALIMGGVMFTVSVFLLSVLKLTAFETGLTLVPMTVGMMAASIVAPKLAVKIGHRYSMIPGLAISIVGCLILRNRFTPDITLTSLLPGMFVFGFGLGLPMSLSIDAPLLTVPRQAQNSCSGLVSTGQSLGLSMGTSVIGTVLTLGAVGGLRQAINTYTPLELSEEAFRANTEMYMQKMGHVDPLNLIVRDQEGCCRIVP